MPRDQSTFAPIKCARYSRIAFDMKYNNNYCFALERHMPRNRAINNITTSFTRPPKQLADFHDYLFENKRADENFNASPFDWRCNADSGIKKLIFYSLSMSCEWVDCAESWFYLCTESNCVYTIYANQLFVETCF